MHISLIANDIRSTHNVGAFFRTCDAFGVDEIIFCGYTPYPKLKNDTRLPHFADKLTRQIHKTALGAESSVNFSKFETVEQVIKYLKDKGATLIALEQSKNSVSLEDLTSRLGKKEDKNLALFIGNEIHGVSEQVLNQMDYIAEIPMHGVKESLNVSVATGIALYQLTRLKT